MKLKYYGTAASEGFPGVFCECDTCKKARELGGKNLRKRSQATVDDTLLLDLCPDTYTNVMLSGLDLCRIENLLVTHSHFDHLDAETLRCVSTGKAKRNSDNPFTVYSAKSGYDKICNVCSDVLNDGSNRLEVKLVKPFESFEVAGYTVIPLPANHTASTSPLNYIISKDGKSMLYAHDTGPYEKEVYDYLENSGIYLGLVTIDCTYGVQEKENLGRHLNLQADAEIAEKLKELGVCDEKTIFVANHFSHNCGSNYDELCSAAKDTGFIISYDGLEIEF